MPCGTSPVVTMRRTRLAGAAAGRPSQGRLCAADLAPLRPLPERGRPRLDAAKVKAAEKFDGKFVVISNDYTLSAEDIALGYKGAWIIESCFRRMKQTGLDVRPMFHWTPRRIEAHAKERIRHCTEL